MLSLEQIVGMLQDRNLNEISRRTGLTYKTIWNIANGRAGDVSYKTVKTLSDYLER